MFLFPIIAMTVLDTESVHWQDYWVPTLYQALS
jgi:hypothetical protein